MNEKRNVDILQGLSTEQIQQRIEKKQINHVKKKSEKSYFSIIIKNTFTFYNLLLAIVTFCFILAKLEITKYTFLLYALANTLIAIIQESKAKHTVDKLTLITSPTNIVVRNGKEIKIKSSELVKDDVIKLAISEQIPADCIVVEGNIETNESMLTGESLSIKKKPGDIFSDSVPALPSSMQQQSPDPYHNTGTHPIVHRRSPFPRCPGSCC